MNQGSSYIEGRRTTCFRKAKGKAMLEPPWAKQSSAVPTNNGRSKSIVFRAGCCKLMDPCRANPESDTSQLGQPCCTFAHSLGSVWAMELMQRFLCVCDSAFLWNGRLFRLPTHPAFGKMYSATAQSSRERELSCCKQQTSIHAGRAGGSAECAWIQCSWDPDTAVCELYQEDTIEPLPKFSTCIE